MEALRRDDETSAARFELRWTDDLAPRLFALPPWERAPQRYVAESRVVHAALPAEYRSICP